jgi:hypothetical protein
MESLTLTRRSFALSAVPAAALGLAGCASGNIITPTQIGAWAQTLQGDVQSLCGYLPYVVDLETLIATFISAAGVLITPLNVLANQICAAAGPPAVASRRGSTRMVPAAVVVNNVIIHFD